MRIEKYVEDEVVREARRAGWRAKKLTWRGERDAPDYLFLRKGRHIYIEFKSPGEKPRAGQLREHAEIREYGGEVHVVETIEQGYRALGLPA